MSVNFDIPKPSGEIFSIESFVDFVPVPELNKFIESTILNEDHELCNPDHIHLLQADIGFLWTTKPNKRHMRIVAGEAEMPNFKGGAWQKARQEQQMMEWFGFLPDFVITLDATFRKETSDIAFLALLEHELYHCGQKSDMFGMPQFRKSDGKPIFGMRGHDVEEFTGVVRRYGIEATGQDRVEFVEAALQEPAIAPATIKALCGSCV